MCRYQCMGVQIVFLLLPISLCASFVCMPLTVVSLWACTFNKLTTVWEWVSSDSNKMWVSGLLRAEKAKDGGHITNQITAWNRDFQTLLVTELACNFLKLVYPKVSNSKAQDLTLIHFRSKSFKAVPWLTRLATSVSMPSHKFNPRPIHVGFVVDKRVLGQGFLRVILFPLSLHSSSAPYWFIRRQHCSVLISWQRR